MKGLGWKMMVLIILAGIVFLWLIKAPIMSTYLTNRLKIPVSVGSISMWPSQTVIKNFKVNNPRGFKPRHALIANRTEVDYRLHNLFGNPSEIDQIAMDGIYLSIELSNPSGSQNNWTAIGSRIPEEKNPRHVIIHKLILTNITVEVHGFAATLAGVPETQHIDRLEFDEIDSLEGFPTKELINKIFQGAGLQQYIQNLFNPENLYQELTNPLKSLGVESQETGTDG